MSHQRFYFLLFLVRGLDCVRQDKYHQRKPLNVHREEPYKCIMYSSDGITLSSVVGLGSENKLVSGGIEKETESIFQNAESILESHGSSLDKVYSVSINLENISDTQIVNEIFQKYFQEPYPKKTIKEVTRLPLDAKIEADISATMTMGGQLFKVSSSEADY